MIPPVLLGSTIETGFVGCHGSGRRRNRLRIGRRTRQGSREGDGVSKLKMAAAVVIVTMGLAGGGREFGGYQSFGQTSRSDDEFADRKEGCAG